MNLLKYLPIVKRLESQIENLKKQIEKLKIDKQAQINKVNAYWKSKQK